MTDKIQNIKEIPKPLILVVDDKADNLKLLGNVLHAEDCRIAFANDGVSALESVKLSKPNLILLDVMMPGMNGFEVCKRLKQSVETRDIPVIFLTAMSETENILEGFESGSVDYVTKPFQASELLARVRTHLELKRAHDHEKLLVRELRAALEKVKTLSGLLPICACCKKIRNDDGYWDQLEFYIQQHSEAEFSHGLCPDCLRRTYKESGLELPPELQDDDS